MELRLSGLKKWLAAWVITFLTGVKYTTRGSRTVDKLLLLIETKE